MIDWSNSITKGLLICYTGADKLCRNLVNHQKPATTVGRNFSATKYGIFSDFSDNKSVFSNGTADSALTYFKNIPWNYSAKNSIFTVMTFATVETNAPSSGPDVQVYITDRNSTNNDWSFQLGVRNTNLSDPRSVHMVVIDGTVDRNIYSTTQITDNDPHVYFGRYLGDGLATGMDIWLDGKKETLSGSSTVSTVGYTINTASTNSVCCGGYYNFAGKYSCVGNHFISAYWNRLLTDEEIVYLSNDPFQILYKNKQVFIPGKPVIAPADQGVHASEFIEASIDHSFAKYTPEEGENRLVVVYINLERSDNSGGADIGTGITSVTIGGVEATEVIQKQVVIDEGGNVYRGTVSYIGYIKEADIKSGNMYIKYTEDGSPNIGEGSAIYCQTLFNVDQTNPVYSIASGGPGEPFTLTIPTIKGGYLVATHSEIESTARYTFSNLIDKWSATSANGLMSTSGAAVSSQGGVVNITITETTAVGSHTCNTGVAANFRPVDTSLAHAVRVR